MKQPLRQALVALGLALLASETRAQTVWVPLTTSQPPGTPAELIPDSGSSSQGRSVFELRIHGFWRETVLGADGVKYERIRVPGMGEIGQQGAPELPALRTRIAVPTTAEAVTLQSLVVPTGELFTFQYDVYPTPKPGADGSDDLGAGDPAGTEEEFVIDPSIYGTNANWPATQASPSATVQPFFGTVRAAEVLLTPVRSNPVQPRLTIARRSIYTYLHGGVLSPSLPQSIEMAKLAAVSCVNWPTASAWFATNTTSYSGRYLIVTTQHNLPALAPFVEHRKSMGFQVAIRTLESLPFVSCGEIRAAIEAWRLLGPANADNYCLLVGTAGVLPLCPSATPGQIPGDDLYGSPAGTGGLLETVFVGRLPASTPAEVTHMLDKIIDYELDQQPGHDYRRVVLAAHKEGAPGKYVGAHEAVANANYTVDPIFNKRYGDSPSGTDSGVISDVEAGRGLVAYRGHGTQKTWVDWNLAGENLTDKEVKELKQAQLPVVWSFSCTNSGIDLGPTIAAAWLQATGGAVAHYGSTRVSGTKKNHTLDANMFRAVWDLGLTTHSLAIAWSEMQMDAAHPDSTHQNSWMYHLLGCPAMKVRRDKTKELVLTLPPVIPASPNPQNFTVIVTDTNGVPQPGVLVSVWKESFDPQFGPDEILVSLYTGTGGQATFPGPTSLGAINTTGRDDDGNVAKELSAASTGAFQKLGKGTAGTQSVVPRLDSSSSLQAALPVSIRVQDARAAAPGIILVSLNDNPTPLFGGTVYTIPEFYSQGFLTDGFGDWTLFVPSWPAGLPSNLELFFQAGIVDPQAVDGVALTNALRAVTP
ncbi:MAG: hypothetical protein GC161_14995 [Planctomycetaceae bacterium]|nr:hypothetical protein [Planctomycetaceae bacterium]